MQVRVYFQTKEQLAPQSIVVFSKRKEEAKGILKRMFPHVQILHTEKAGR